MSSNPVHGEMYLIQHYVIKFVGDLRQVGGFLRFPGITNKTDRLDITEILLKVALNIITLTLSRMSYVVKYHSVVVYMLEVALLRKV